MEAQGTAPCENKMFHGHAAKLNPGAVLQRKLKINEPRDVYEQEADRVAEQVMRMPEPPRMASAGSNSMIGGSGSAPGVQRKCECGGTCAECKKKHVLQELPKVQLKAAGPGSASGVEAPPIVHEVLSSPGKPLDAGTRAFMEPRFGHDFSHVRVHTDEKAAQSARAVQARAYTVGQNVVFGAGEYGPGTQAGQRLLGHELTHVLQQSGNTSGQMLHRDLVPYGQITWADFKGTAPAVNPGGDSEGAGIRSPFDPMPSFSAKLSWSEIKPIKHCGKGKRETQFEATAVPDDDSYKGPYAKMDTDQSWARPLYKTGDVTDYCNNQVAKCDKAYTDAVRAGNQGIEFNRIKVLNKGDCKKLVFPQCRDKDAPAERARLLKHEQYHFNITNVIANNARNDLSTRAKALRGAGSGCGYDAAKDAARADYESKVQAALRDPLQVWLKAKDKAQNDYDHETGHGGDKGKQATWEKQIDGGLHQYDPAPPGPPAATPSPSPTTTTPTTAPPKQGSPPDAPPQGQRKTPK
jgi:hypothetical protein